MSEQIRQRTAAAVGDGRDVPGNVLEDFQSRIHADPNDKSEDPPERDPAHTDTVTLTWHEIPAWQKDNEYILTGYRRTQHSFRGCAISVFAYVHNETVNIHSHLFGGLLFCWLLGTYRQTYLSQYDTTTWVDAAVFAIFLASAVLCLFGSASYHTFGVHSRGVAERCNSLDYAGIVVLIVGSSLPCIYYNFFCEWHFQILYLLLISSAGLAAAYIVLNPEYRKPTHRGARTKVFIGLGLCGIVPVTQGMVTHGFMKLCHEMGFGWLFASGVLYINGALLYANRVPERFAPGRFDYFFSSHQIFHVHVVLAALATHQCILTAFDYRHGVKPFCAA
ncbi:uncharacterized protein PHACADRAFT_89788 [Phanerochaete carnosa HHB-10118-sp]|uniref:Uncharacterized protein n=1 Tax=Phanerochaete carnosa (strain HHB-10118-sp) TaxID=650164 RepID=K5V5T5_PHACS|nr:uncharacterized protein PHACADRAFT_89788 [Phanerochaete carnosa HHB-10118-sp]EKM58051.1 hypothetical protein PHACADRAFT_89788 [Phanerochaete carnosa HHB-10118-sp]